MIQVHCIARCVFPCLAHSDDGTPSGTVDQHRVGKSGFLAGWGRPTTREQRPISSPSLTASACAKVFGFKYWPGFIRRNLRFETMINSGQRSGLNISLVSCRRLFHYARSNVRFARLSAFRRFCINWLPGVAGRVFYRCGSF